MTRLRPALVAIAGPIGSGKTTTARLLSQHTGWPATSYGDAVRAAAAARGIPGDRHQLQRIGAQLIARGWDAFTERVLDQVTWKPGDAVIVEGLRHAEAVAALRQITAPLPAFLFYLDLPAAECLARATTRDSKPNNSDAAYPVERDLPVVRALADLIVPVHDRDPAAVTRQILAYVTERSSHLPGARHG